MMLHPASARIASLIILATFPVLHGKPSSRLHRGLQDECLVTGFSLYHPTGANDGIIFDLAPDRTAVLLDKYPDAPEGVNFIANTTGVCPCVKVAFANATKVERDAPYSFYGDDADGFKLSIPPSGFNYIEASTYTDEDCTQGESGYTRLGLTVIPVSEGTLRASLVTVVYEGTTGTATITESELVANTTCTFIGEYLRDGFTFRTNRFLGNYECIPTFPAGPGALTIVYDIITTFVVNDVPNPYTILGLPTPEELENALQIVEEGTTFPGDDNTLLDELQSVIPQGSPYSTLTGIVLDEMSVVFTVETIDEGSCFSEVATVAVENHASPVAMKDLQIGDRILTNIASSEGKAVYEPVYTFGHKNMTQSAKFLQISTNGDQSSSASPLEISEEHMMFVKAKAGPVRADSIRVGDVLADGSVVMRIGAVKRDGLYAPLTPSGTIVVNGLLVSAYAGVLSTKSEYVQAVQQGGNGKQNVVSLPLLQSDAIHVFMSPLRVACHGLSTKFCHSQNSKGLNSFVAFGMGLLEWGLQKSAVVQVVTLFSVLAVTSVFFLTETLMSSYGALLLLSVAAWKVVTTANKKRAADYDQPV